MSYSEWCPICGEQAVTVTRGIPSMATCKNGHVWDRRDSLRRAPSEMSDYDKGYNDALSDVYAALDEGKKYWQDLVERLRK